MESWSADPFFKRDQVLWMLLHFLLHGHLGTREKNLLEVVHFGLFTYVNDLHAYPLRMCQVCLV